MLATALWLDLLGVVGVIVFVLALVTFMFGPLFYAEYRVGKDRRASYSAATPERQRRMRAGAWLGGATAVIAAAGGIVAAAAGGVTVIIALIGVPVLVILLSIGRVATQAGRGSTKRSHDDAG